VTTVDASAVAASTVRVGTAASVAAFWFISLSPVIVGGSELHGLVMAFWRSCIGLVLFGAWVLARGEITWAIMWRCAPSGLCFGGGIGLFFWSAQLTSIANASLLTLLQPIVLLFAAVLVFGEKVSKADLAWAAIAISGAIVIVVAGNSGAETHLGGDVLAGVSVIIGSGYLIFGRKVLQTVSLTAFMVGLFAWAVVSLAPVVGLLGEPILPDRRSDWVRLVAIGILPGIGHFLLNYAQNKAPLNLMGVIQLLVPVNATLLAFWLLDQSVTVFQVIGMAVVIGALLVQTVFRAPAKASVAGEP
jgi:drug/metabolite transporter (DMT)-like permease